MARVLFINEFWSLHIKIRSKTILLSFFSSANSFYHIVSFKHLLFYKYACFNNTYNAYFLVDGQNFIPFVAIFCTRVTHAAVWFTRVTTWLSRHRTRDSSIKVWLTTVNRGAWSNSLVVNRPVPLLSWKVSTVLKNRERPIIALYCI